MTAANAVLKMKYLQAWIKLNSKMELLFLIALAPVVALILYIYQKDRYDREPPALLVKIFIYGALTVIPVYIVEKILSIFDVFTGLLSAAYTSFIIAGLTEEYFKRLVVTKFACPNKNYDEKLDGIVYSVMSALGFASVENVMYLLRGMRNFVYTGISRGIFAVPAHMLFGITMGYYLSLSKFADDEAKQNTYFRKSLYVPALLHGIYDFTLISGFTNLIFVFIAFVFYLWKVNLNRLNEYVEESRYKNRG